MRLIIKKCRLYSHGFIRRRERMAAIELAHGILEFKSNKLVAFTIKYICSLLQKKSLFQSLSRLKS